MNVFGSFHTDTRLIPNGDGESSSGGSHEELPENNKTITEGDERRPETLYDTNTAYFSQAHQIGSVMLYGIPIVSLIIEGKERLCLAQISSTLLKDYSYNEIHNRRVALGITCAQCTPVQLELLRRAGAMPVTSRRCGMITRREAERLCKSFLGDHTPPKLPDNFAFDVSHQCAWGCRGAFLPSRYNSSRAKCIRCLYCGLFFSPNKFIFHSHRLPDSKYVEPDAANFNSWRRHIHLTGTPPEEVIFAWEDVKAMFNGGSRKRVNPSSNQSSKITAESEAVTSASDTDVPTPEPTPLVKPKQLSIPKPFTGTKKQKIEVFSNPALDLIPAMATPVVSAPPPGPVSANPTLFPPINMLLPRKVNSEPQILDYVWNSNRLWNPYLNTLPLHPYLYNCGYLMKPADLTPWSCRNRPILSTNMGGAAALSLDFNRETKLLPPAPAAVEDEAEGIVDVESTDC